MTWRGGVLPLSPIGWGIPIAAPYALVPSLCVLHSSGEAEEVNVRSVTISGGGTVRATLAPSTFVCHSAAVHVRIVFYSGDLCILSMKGVKQQPAWKA